MRPFSCTVPDLACTYILVTPTRLCLQIEMQLFVVHVSHSPLRTASPLSPVVMLCPTPISEMSILEPAQYADIAPARGCILVPVRMMHVRRLSECCTSGGCWNVVRPVYGWLTVPEGGLPLYIAKENLLFATMFSHRTYRHSLYLFIGSYCLTDSIDIYNNNILLVHLQL